MEEQWLCNGAQHVSNKYPHKGIYAFYLHSELWLMLKSFSLKDMWEKVFWGIQIAHIYQPNKGTLVNKTSWKIPTTCTNGPQPYAQLSNLTPQIKGYPF